MNLRPYQTHAVEGAFREWSGGNRSTLIVMPTGCGKTVVFSEIIRRHLAESPSRRCLVLAHREELIKQATDKIKRVAGVSSEIEMADQRADKHGMWRRAPVIVSSIQTQVAGAGQWRRMHRFDPAEFGLVIIDEAHHATAASYRKVIEHYAQNPEAKLLGVTATPDRADKAAMGTVFNSVAYVYGINDAIRDGWLVNIRQKMVYLEGLDYSKCRVTAGDLNGADMAEVLEHEEMPQKMASSFVDECGGMKSLLFAATVKQAEMLCEILNRHRPMCARIVTGTTKSEERAEIFRSYAAGEFPYLCNVGVATEGFDDPSIECVVLCRPTRSRALYVQMIGRGLRPLPNLVDGIDEAEDRRAALVFSDKRDCTVLDFYGASGKHKLVHAADILGGDERVTTRARQIIQERGECDVKQAIDEAAAELAEEEERRKRLAEAGRKAKIIGKAKYRVVEIDAFNTMDLAPPREVPWHRGREISEKMRGVLERAGVPDIDKLTYTQAKALISEIFRRRESNLCTFKQAAYLRRNGISGDQTFEEASRLISALRSGQPVHVPPEQLLNQPQEAVDTAPTIHW